MMKAYSSSDLYNREVQEQVSEAFLAACINERQYKNILEAHPSKLYTPNYFIRIALGLLSVIAILFSSLLLGLIFDTDSSGAIIMLLFLMAFLCYLCLELFVKSKFYYNAGIDNILMLSTMILITSVFFVDDLDHQNITASGAMIVICLWMMLRFTDAFMAMLAYTSFFVFVFLLYSEMGQWTTTTIPFVMMGLSVVIYIVTSRLAKNENLFFYRNCCKGVLVLTLVSFYISGNYFVVKELGGELLDLSADQGVSLPFGWLFWVLTMAIPAAYIVYGLMKKDLLFIRTGLVLIAVSIFTVRYYYDIMSAEGVMLIAGIILIAISYALIKALHKPRLGFTAEKLLHSNKDLLNIEALIIAQTVGKGATSDIGGVQFGGGSGGGGGATGGY